MPCGSGNNDTGGMVWGSMIGKKLFGSSGLPSGRASFRSAARARGSLARLRPGEGGWMSSISARWSAFSVLSIDGERIQLQSAQRILVENIPQYKNSKQCFIDADYSELNMQQLTL
jgi:hypothetical protein